MTESVTGSRSQEEEVPLLGLVNILLRHRHLVIGVTLFCFVAAVVITLLMPRSYTASAAFMPQTRKTMNTLSGLAAQFGFSLPTSETVQTPAFYADLVQSRSILGTVVTDSFKFRVDGQETRGSLIDYYRSKGATQLRRRDAAIRRLESDVDASTIQRTGVVTLDVTVRQADLAVQINRRLLDLLNEFNLQTRQSQAAQERRFTERRLAEVRQDLRAAEDRLQQFLQRNRDYRNSPELTFQADRLRREVTMQQEVYTTLTQAFEQAKIEEVRDTPVITVIQQPEMPARPDPRGLMVKGLLGLLVGLAIGAVLALWKSYSTNLSFVPSPEAAEFAVLRQQTARELVRPWRTLAQLFGRERRAEP